MFQIELAYLASLGGQAAVVTDVAPVLDFIDLPTTTAA